MSTRQGFTLIELLIVIAIIAILAAVLIPNLLSARQRAYDSSTKYCAQQIALAQEIYQIDHDTYTSALASLDSGVLRGCDTVLMTIVLGSANSSSYQASVRHNQSSRTWLVTPNGIH